MFMISMTWLEETPSPGVKGSQGQAGWPGGSPTSDVSAARSRLEEAARHEDLEGSFSTRAWRDADKPPNPNTEQRRRSISSTHSPAQASPLPMRCSDDWRLKKLHEEEVATWSPGVSKQGTTAVKTWQRTKAD
ncbi:hypothetical protein COCSUDRAFT_68346 [Coccomyxa subellipsoidea C-169]|uniref:Uncharacterized protein n=1 Tax=Coccomyxa subellipsoidea (strain C-169) TaxID=574566 RepID=I0YIK2_COCSC|nr:hypothetical protein COCSUDRAFT_68346 [Coccomyxa subellipsoidea C-169]EIE18221.1 hypothetical protein COCSUDRAFT_68346 [Coccomyxa subellipsoidea C-169]|eukprot:XP_005642765.1 hypothetical protein COCSUDRAFT_68346 [Coccomyxa subellipsoidea C-169]